MPFLSPFLVGRLPQSKFLKKKVPTYSNLSTGGPTHSKPPGVAGGGAEDAARVQHAQQGQGAEVCCRMNLPELFFWGAGSLSPNVYICIYVCIYAYTHIHIYICIYIYIYIAALLGNLYSR